MHIVTLPTHVYSQSDHELLCYMCMDFNAHGVHKIGAGLLCLFIYLLYMLYCSAIKFTYYAQELCLVYYHYFIYKFA